MNTEDDSKAKFQELHSLLVDHMIGLLRSGKALKGSTLAIMVNFLKLNNPVPDAGRITPDLTKEYLADLEELPFP